jgi:PD-(D/E)XK nuclease superfamily
MTRHTVGPSQLGWLRADCERCFVREVRHRVRRPGGPPDAFNLADAAMKARFDGGPDIVHDLGVGPRFRVVAQGLWVESYPVPFPEHGFELVVRGKLDALVRTVDGETLVVDYKTSAQGELAPRTYGPQLHAYALALEAPAAGTEPVQVDGLALLVYRPTRFTYRTESRVSGLYGPHEWVEVPRDDGAFVASLGRTAALLAGAEPTPNPKCAWCVYYGAVPVGGAA